MTKLEKAARQALETLLLHYEHPPINVPMIEELRQAIAEAEKRECAGLNWLPKHKCGLHISHNEHRDVYETVEEFYEMDDFISKAEWEKAVAEDSVWVLHWYPETPVGFHRIAASTLEAIEAKLKEKTHD